MTPWLQTLFGQGPRLTPQAALAAPKTAGPDTLSDDVASMQSIWRTIADVLEGHDAIKAAGERYLPRFEKESREKYQRRLMDAPWRPIFPAALEKTERNELRRRSILGPDAPDDQAEEGQIALEREGVEPEFEMDPRTGNVIDPADLLEAARG